MILAIESNRRTRHQLRQWRDWSPCFQRSKPLLVAQGLDRKGKGDVLSTIRKCPMGCDIDQPKVASWPRRMQSIHHYCFETPHGSRTDWRKREASQEQKNPVGVSEPAFVEAEMGYALRVASTSWAVRHWPRGFQVDVGQFSSLLGNSVLIKQQSIDNEAKTALKSMGHRIRTK